jgi:polar amino acid transport system substrate-binding protein
MNRQLGRRAAGPLSARLIRALDDFRGCRHRYDRLKDKAVRLMPTSNQEDALKLLLSGKVDAVLGNRLTGEYLLQRIGRQGEIKIVGGQIDTERYGVAVRKGDPVLATINLGLARIRGNGTYDRLYEKWFGEMMGQPARYYKRNLNIALGIVAFLFATAMVIAVFNFSLKREVRKRIREVQEYNLLLQKTNESIEGIRRYQGRLLNSGYGGIVTIGDDGRIKFSSS